MSVINCLAFWTHYHLNSLKLHGSRRNTGLVDHLSIWLAICSVSRHQVPHTNTVDDVLPCPAVISLIHGPFTSLVENIADHHFFMEFLPHLWNGLQIWKGYKSSKRW